MERSGERLDYVQSIFGVYSSNLSTPEVQAINKEWSPKLSAAYDKINLNGACSSASSSFTSSATSLAWMPSRMRLLTRTYEGFVRRGAKLNDAQKAQLSDYNQQLAGAFSDFNSKLLADESTYTSATEAELAGVPADVKDAAAAAAKEAGSGGGHLRHRQHPLGGRAGAELRHQPRVSREGVEGVRAARRQWQRQ